MTRIQTVAGPSQSQRHRPEAAPALFPNVLFVAPVAVEGGVIEVLAGLVRRAAEGGYGPHIVFLRDGPEVKRFLGRAPIVLRAGRWRDPGDSVR